MEYWNRSTVQTSALFLAAIVVLLAIGGPEDCPQPQPPDCNQNGIDDNVDITPNGSMLFGNPIPITETGYIRALAEADFNKDGKDDVIYIVGLSASKLVLRLGTADGPQSTPAFSYNLSSSVAVLAADFTGDSWPDIGLVGSQRVNIIVNTQNVSQPFVPTNGATWISSANYFTDSTGAVQQVHAVDFDSNGTMDIFSGRIAPSSNPNVSILLNQGDGSAWTRITANIGPMHTFGAVVDVNGDGLLDIVGIDNNSFNDPRSLKLVLGGPNNTFTSSQTVYLNEGYPAANAYPMVVNDFTGDVLPDVFMLLNSGQRLRTNGGPLNNQLFSSGQWFEPGHPRYFLKQVAASDLNYDCRSDIVGVGVDWDATIRSNNLIALLGAVSTPPLQETPAMSISFGQSGYSGEVRQLVVGDFNGDGSKDVIAGFSEPPALQLGNLVYFPYQYIRPTSMDCNHDLVPDECQ